MSCDTEEIYGPWMLFLPGNNPGASAKDFMQRVIRENFIALSDALALLDAAVILKGEWDASSGTFPAGDNAGWSYIVNVAGTVDGVDFNIGDRVIALVDGASSTTYAGQWNKSDYTDQVSSVFGRVGIVTAQAGDYNADQITETATRVFVTPAQKAVIDDAVVKTPTAEQEIVQNGYRLVVSGTGAAGELVAFAPNNGVDTGANYFFRESGLYMEDPYNTDHYISISMLDHSITIGDLADPDKTYIEKDRIRINRAGVDRIDLTDDGEAKIDVRGNKIGVSVKKTNGGGNPAYEAIVGSGDQKAMSGIRDGQTSGFFMLRGNVNGTGKGGLEFGTGAVSRDVFLWHDAAEYMKATGTWEFNKVVSTSGILGMTPLAADPVTPVDDTAWIVDAGGQTFLKFRVGGVTKSVELT